MRSLLWASAALASLALIACTELRDADVAPEPDAGEPSAIPDEPTTPQGDAGPSPEAAPPKPPPEDVKCSEPWVKPTAEKKDPTCTGRQVTVLDPVAPIDTNGISIARTPAGRIGISYNAEAMASAGEMRLAVFTPGATTFTTPKILVRKGSDYEHIGHTSKLAVSAPDTFHVLAHDVDDIDDSGDLRIVKLVGAATTFTNIETAMTKVRRGSETALAVDGLGNTFVTARIITGTNKAKLAATRQTGSGAFLPLPDLTTALLPQNVPGSGQTSLFVDATDKLHLAYHHNETLAFSTPRYHVFDGSGWSYRKTVDNNTLEGMAGYGTRLVVFGTRKHVAYFFRKGGQSAGSTTAELRVASWDGSDEQTDVKVIDGGYPAEDLLSPAYRVAMAVDGFGLRHLAVLAPSKLNPGEGHLEYWREVQVAGEKRWLKDIVDDDAFSEYTEAYVDITVEPNGRPHIAYRSGKDSKVRYATRFDR